MPTMNVDRAGLLPRLEQKRSMDAINFHKDLKPRLGRGSHLLPVGDRRVGQPRIRQGVSLLAAAGRTGHPDSRIHYLTPVEIADDMPVAFIAGYGASSSIKGLYFADHAAPLRDLPLDVKQAFTRWWDGYLAGDRSEPGGPLADEPRVIAGRSLSDRCIKWTEDIRLLYGRLRKRRKRLGSSDDL